MPKVKITNLKSGACVINSLKLTIAGMSSVTRDASVVGDSDLAELESYGVVSITMLEDAQPAAPVVRSAPQQSPPQRVPAKGAAKQGKAPPPEKRKPQQPPSLEQPQTPKSQQLRRPGTDFRSVDGPEDEMGGKVIVIGEKGPETHKLDGGLNAKEGPKFAGDDAWQPSDEANSDGFTTI